MTEFLLGLDGGGTKVLAQTATPDGQARGEGMAGACNIAFMPLADARESALAAADAALAQAGGTRAQVRAVCAAVAGTSFAARRAQFLSELQQVFPGAAVAVEPDYAAALTGGTGGAPGIIVIAGTGSVAYGENGAGHAHKTGGYGYLIDDGGSGYGVGRAALAAVLRAADGTGETTTLHGRVLAALRLESLAEVVPGVYGETIDRVTVASLSRVVAEAAREDEDTVARALLMRAGGTLAQLAHGVAMSLFPLDQTFPVIQVGSLWNAGPDLTDVFARSLARFAPGAVLEPPQNPPVTGAVQRAVRLLPPA